MYGHVARVLHVRCEHGAIEMHLPLTHFADAQSGEVPLAHLAAQILVRGHSLLLVQVLGSGVVVVSEEILHGKVTLH